MGEDDGEDREQLLVVHSVVALGASWLIICLCVCVSDLMLQNNDMFAGSQ